LAGFCFAAININTASNAEIADFMENESNKILQIPDSATLTINFQTAKDYHSRAGILFFWGEREVSIKADYTLAIPGKEMLKGSLKADTSWYTGYCGMIECRNRPMPAQQRIETLKALVSKMLTEFNSKVYGVFVEKKAVSSEASSISAADSATEAEDAINTD
jgi:hypothetical protein